MAESPEIARLQHPRFARFYLRLSQAAERHGTAEHRDRLLSGLSGHVIEVGAGNGLNFAHYPPTVTEVLAVEPDDLLRDHATTAAAHVRIPIRVVTGHAEMLPCENAHYDAAVMSLVLCSVPNPARALTEVRRVLRPGGQLRFYEHVRSAHTSVGWLQDMIAPAWSWTCGGCHPNRDTLAAIRKAGFEVDDVERFGFGAGPCAPRMAHILGHAHRP